MTALTTATALSLVLQCAPALKQPEQRVMLAIMTHESALQPYTIHVNRDRAGSRPEKTYTLETEAAAVAVAQALQREGRSFDAGLAQVTTANWPRLGVTAETVFEPCRNVAAGAAVFQAGLPVADRIALSLYNTGDPFAGASNGYISAVERQSRPVAADLAPAPASGAAQPSEPNWNVSAEAEADRQSRSQTALLDFGSSEAAHQ